MAIGISPALPLAYDQLDGPFRLTKTLKEAITLNFKNLVLTNPGEKIMDPEFGVGIKRYLFELDNDGLKGEIAEKINQQVSIYLSSTVNVIDIRFTEGSSYKGDQVSISNSNSIYLHILFEILPVDSIDVLSIPLSSAS